MKNEMPNKHIDETQMECPRQSDLVAYLYQEASEAAAKDFAAHLQACALCRAQLLTFKEVRARILHWRTEALGSLPATTPHWIAPAVESVTDASALAQNRPRSRSARAALRDFFSLAPLWMRAGIAFATLVICALAALAVANAELRWESGNFAFRTGLAPVRVVEKRVPVPTAYTDEELNARAEKLAHQKFKALQDQLAINDAERIASIKGADAVKRHRARTFSDNIMNNAEVAASSSAPLRPAPRKLRAPQFNEQTEEDLPRLSDLLADAGQ